MILRLTNTRLTNDSIVVKNNTNITNQYHTIKLRLHGVNSSCMIQNEIPNTAKLKLVTDVFISHLFIFCRM